MIIVRLPAQWAFFFHAYQPYPGLPQTVKPSRISQLRDKRPRSGPIRIPTRDEDSRKRNPSLLGYSTTPKIWTEPTSDWLARALKPQFR